MNSHQGLDDVLQQLGVGPWTFCFFTPYFLVSPVLAVFLIGSEFMNPVPNFTCNVSNTSYTSFNGSECVMVEEERVPVPCTSWTYDTSVFHSTIAMEWDLVCKREPLAPLYQTLYTLGCLLGFVVSAYTAHRFGRRWAVRMGALGTTLGMVVLLTTPWLYLLLVSRFFLGVTTATMISPSFMIGMEVCVPRLRPTVGVVLALPYALMMIVFTVLAYFIRDWRPLHAAATFPSLLLLLVAVYLVDESPRWLLVHGRVHETVKVLQRGARLNKVMLPETTILTTIISPTSENYRVTVDKPLEGVNLLSMQTVTREKQENLQSTCTLAEPDHDPKSAEQDDSDSICSGELATIVLGAEDGLGSWWAGPAGLVRTSCMRKIMCVLCIMWFLQGVVYLGLPLNSDAFSSPYLYMALLGVVEVPAYSLPAPITQRLGRRPVISSCFVTCGILLLLLLVLTFTTFYHEWISLMLVLLSYLLVCTSYQVNYLFAPELLPTTLRPWGTAACLIAAHLGFCVPPFLTNYLTEEQTLLVFGLCAVLAGMLVFLLPETNGQPLLETVADLRERLSHKKLNTTAEDINKP